MFPLPFVDFPGPILAAILFLSLIYLQMRRPLRVQHFSAWTRIFRNLILAAPALILLRLIMIPIPYFVAIWARAHNIGILNWLSLPPWLAATAGALLFDYAYYWWHVGTHRIPLLWRFHNVHHTDLDMDVSTAARFHFLEIGFSVVYRIAIVLIIGIAPLVYLFYEMIFRTGDTVSSFQLAFAAPRRGDFKFGHRDAANARHSSFDCQIGNRFQLEHGFLLVGQAARFASDGHRAARNYHRRSGLPRRKRVDSGRFMENAVSSDSRVAIARWRSAHARQSRQTLKVWRLRIWRRLIFLCAPTRRAVQVLDVRLIVIRGI